MMRSTSLSMIRMTVGLHIIIPICNCLRKVWLIINRLLLVQGAAIIWWKQMQIFPLKWMISVDQVSLKRVWVSTRPWTQAYLKKRSNKCLWWLYNPKIYTIKTLKSNRILTRSATCLMGWKIKYLLVRKNLIN